jgi:hypothetical protein
MEDSSPYHKPKKPDQGVGPLVGIIIIVGLIALGGVYFLVMQELQHHTPQTDEQAISG